VFIYPFIEQTALYERLDNFRLTDGFNIGIAAEVTRAGDAASNWWEGGTSYVQNPLNEQERKGFGSVTTYICPTRRGGGTNIVTYTDTGSSADAYVRSGPVSDYAIIMLVPPMGAYDDDTLEQQPMTGLSMHSAAYTNNWWDTLPLAPNQNIIRVPFRLAITDAPATALGAGGNPRKWRAYEPRDTFAWLADGTSNQLLIGEKFIQRDNIGVCTGDGLGNGDCSYLYGGCGNHEAAAHAIRSIDHWNGTTCRRMGIAKPDYNPSNYRTDVGFGSSHPGICNFLLGDGSIRGFAVTTKPILLIRLADVADGGSVTLPN
jgi:hypothetical protein